MLISTFSCCRVKKKHVIFLIMLICLSFQAFRYFFPTLIGGISCPAKEYPYNPAQGSVINPEDCEVIHIGIHCFSTQDTYQLMVTVKSLLNHSENAIELYIVTFEPEVKRVLDNLFNTWELQHVETHIFLSSLKNSALDYFLLEQPVPRPKAMILLSPGIFFTKDIKFLWTEAMKQSQVIEAVLPSHPDSTPDYKQLLPSMFILRPEVLESRIICTEKEIDLNGMEVVNKYAYGIKCKMRELTTEAVKRKVLGDILHHKPHKFDGLFFLEQTNISSTFQQLYRESQLIEPYSLRNREVHLPCRQIFQKQVLQYDKYSSDPCYEYRYSSCSTHLTQLYFGSIHTPRPKLVSVPSDSKVSAVTQLQYNRFPSVKRIIENWKSPIHVVLYLNVSEAVLLQGVLKDNPSLNRENIYYHVVYKHLVHYPINYIRNVGLKEVTSEYVFVFDVDFVPVEGLDSQLVNAANLYGKLDDKKAFVVPSFEGMSKDYVMASNKEQLLHDMESGKVIPYHQGPGQFKSGHKATNYNKWKIAKEPYRVSFDGSFEPYVMLKTADSPLYYEIQLERMGDKYSYTLEIVKKGIHLVVLHNLFMVHFPHSPSISHKLTSMTFQRCFKYYYRHIEQNLNILYHKQ